MELTKRKEELMAYLEMNANNSNTGIALRDFLRESGSTSRFDMESKNSTEEEGSSGESEELPEAEREEVMEEVKEHEDARDDEDFIMIVQPKGKKKAEKKLIKPSTNKLSSNKKRKCEFCGTVETPMWRRGPTGKGTLCNACGVKWSLKFRKRAGKKPNKTDRTKDQPREQRQSTRKKLLPKKTHTPPPEEDQGLCCNHSLRRKREEDDNQPIKRPHCSDDSDDSTLGKLLDVVEVRLGEEEQLQAIREDTSLLRTCIETTHRGATHRLDLLGVRVTREFEQMREYLEQLTTLVGHSEDPLLAEWRERGLGHFLHMEEGIKSDLASAKSSSDRDFEDLYKKLDSIDTCLEKSS